MRDGQGARKGPFLVGDRSMRFSAIISRVDRLARLTGRRFAEDRCSRVAGALSYATLFALVPLSAVLVAMVSVFPAFHGLIDRVQSFAYQNFVPATGEVVSRYLAQFAQNAGKLTVWGLLFVFLASLMVLATIERTFNDIWHVRNTRKRVHRFLAYWAIITAGPILIGVGLYVTSYVASLPLLARGEMLAGVRTLLVYGIAPVAEWLAFLLLYTVVPNYPVRPRDAAIGAAIAMVLFEIAKRAFALFVVSFPTYRLLYGAMAALPIFLLWLYISWVVILLGAVVTAVLPQWRGRPVPEVSSGWQGMREKLRAVRARQRRRH